MTTQHQQILLFTTLLAGSVLIGVLTYRAPPLSTAEVDSEVAPPPVIATPPLPPASHPSPVSAKKARFFKRLIPLIAHQNNLTLQTRAELIRMGNRLKLGQPLSPEDQQTLQLLAKRYRLRSAATIDSELIETLLSRVDIVPPSLALAQAAAESAWGQSRFAREANNLFGQWCFSKGCGLVPRRRPAGMTHEVASYPSWQKSVRAYFLNLNSHPAYQPLRDIRLQQRQKNRVLPGELLAQGLVKYSARGTTYVESLQQIIRVNDLARLDQL